MTTLETLAIRINGMTPGLMVSAEMLAAIAQALALDEDARILFVAQIHKGRPPEPSKLCEICGQSPFGCHGHDEDDES